MPKQTGLFKISGTLGDVTYYQSGKQHFQRKKSSLTKDRVKKDPAFARSRKASKNFAVAAKLASRIYQKLPKEKRVHGLIGVLTGTVNRLLKEGVSAREAKKRVGEGMNDE
jgi:hypothetical protein